MSLQEKMLLWKKYTQLTLAAAALSITVFVATADAAAEIYIPEVHSPEEITSKWEQYKPVFEGDPFVVKPQVSAPYFPGKLHQPYIQDGVNMTNFVRYLAGLPDNIVQNEALNEQAQFGAVLLAANEELTHNPQKPQDMDDNFYQIGSRSTSSSNIYEGERQTDRMVLGYMSDSDSSNIDRVGHRRWILSPALVNTGFGYALSKSSTAYSPMQVFDRSGQAAFSAPMIAWPSPGAFPTNAFSSGDAWSATLNPMQYQTPLNDQVKVTLKRINDGRTWTFDHNDDDKEDISRNYFHVDSGSYGAGPSIIFRPQGAGHPADVDQYEAQIEGIQTLSGEPATIKYKVSFFDIPEKENQAAYLTQWRLPRPELSKLPVTFKNADFELRVRAKLGNVTGVITEADLTRIPDFYYAHNQETESDEDLLAKLTGLTSLSFNGQVATGVSPILNLTNLKILSIFADFGEKPIIGISSLAGMKQLQSLSIYGQVPIETLTELLTQMPMLVNLTLDNDKINDLSFIPSQTLSKLTYLSVKSAALHDVSALAQTTKLLGLVLQGNHTPLADLNPIWSLSTLELLELKVFGYTNIVGIEKLTALRSINLLNNTIRDISPLSTLTKLETLNINGNRIRDISPLAGLTSIKTLYMDYNGIHDISTIMNENFNIQQLTVTGNFLDMTEGSKTKQWLEELSAKPMYMGSLGAMVTGSTARYERQQQVEVSDVRLSYQPEVLQQDRYMLSGDVIPAQIIASYNDYDEKTFDIDAIWESSNPDIVAFKDGQLISKKPGYSTISVKADGLDKTFYFHVLDKPNMTYYYANSISEPNKKLLKDMIVLKVNHQAVLVNGYATQTTAKPFVDPPSASTLLPVRFVSENLQSTVKWDNATQTVTVVSEDESIHIVIRIGVSTMQVNDATIELPVAARIVEGSTYLPLRALCEALGKKVAYDGGIIVISPQEFANGTSLLTELKTIFVN